MNTEILSKLKKLLNLSNSATTAEAENAMEKAVALATKHGIDLSTVVLNVPEKEEMIQTEYMEGKRKCVAQKFISAIIQKHFNVNLVYSGSRWSGQKICFLGRKSDVEFAVYVQEFLKEHMMRAWNTYQKAHKVDTRLRATFLDGFWRGLDQKLSDAKKNQENSSFGEIHESLRKDAMNNYSLIVQSEKVERERFVSSRYAFLRKTASSRYTNYGGEVQSAGFRHGNTTNIFRPIGGGLALTE